MKKIITCFMITMATIWHSHADSDLLSSKKVPWSFDGFFGTIDTQSVQRGYQVYKEVCAACHAMKFISYRNLEDVGFSEEEVKSTASEYTVIDGPDDNGDMFERSARPSDRFVAPFPNEQAARVANGGAHPVDLSLIIKARPHGADYVYSLLTGYAPPPPHIQLAEGMYYNPYFAGEQIAMPPPLSTDLISYQDGTFASVDQMSRDVVHFLQWASEPEMGQRKRIGIKVFFYLSIFTLIFYLAKRRIWSRLEQLDSR